MHDPAVAEPEDGDRVDALEATSGWCVPEPLPRWVAEHLNRPTTLSPSAIRSTNSVR
jgi:hypothetical protein